MNKIIFPLLLMVCVLSVPGCGGNRGSVVVLLPDADGRVGKVEVKNSKGSVLIVEKYEKVSFKKQQKPESSGIMPEQKINKIFATALATQPVPPTKFFLNFYWGSDKIVSESLSVIKKIVKNIRERTAPQIIIRGHTDRSGAENINYKLSQKRAKKVKVLLSKEGILSGSISVSFYGENELLIKTADDVPKLLNRRVEVIVR